jgi:hypothetical protein
MTLEYNDENVARIITLYKSFEQNKGMMNLTRGEEYKKYATRLLEDVERIESDIPHYLRLKLGLERTTLDNLKKSTQMRINSL